MKNTKQWILIGMSLSLILGAATFADTPPKDIGSLKQASNGYVTNIEKVTLQNEDFRRVLFTGPHSQLVVMSLKGGEDIGRETHNVDQFIRIERGDGKLVLSGKEYDIHAESAFVIPAGTEHNIMNTGKDEMKLYSVYSPALHREGTVHKTKADAKLDKSNHS